MSLPPASAPVAVLVLAWDETTPAVRALVEAAAAAEPAADSLVVLVPAGSATEELTQEEFLPLADSVLLVAELLAAEPAALSLPPTSLSPPLATSQATPESLPIDLAALEAPSFASPAVATATTALALPEEPETSLPTVPSLATQGIPVVAAPGWPVVRVLGPSDYSLAALSIHAQQARLAPTWTGTANPPAAPYLGSTVAGPLPLGSTLGFVATVADSAPAFVSASADLIPPTSETNPPNPHPGAPLPSYPIAEALADSEAEAAAVAGPLPLLFAAAETSTTELREEVAAETAGSSAVAVTPVQAGWPEPLAPLPAPATSTTAASPSFEAAGSASNISATAALSEPIAQPSYPELRPATGPFDAPNLNFQIIQYARFAVPLALAAEPFAVIYAPAWPTWLAAQELRHRTGCPLVLHVAALAADTEPLALAAGWPAEIQRQALHRADLILTETLALAHRLRRELDLPAHRVRPVPAADAAAVAHALNTAQVR